MRINLALLVAIGLAGCGGDEPAGPGGPGPGDPDNVPPTLAGVADQSVVRNTLTAGSVVVELEIDDPDDDSFSVTAVSTDPAVLPGVELTCGLDPCPLTLAPVASANAAVSVTVTAADGRGGEASTTFTLDIAPRLVTTAADDGAGSLRRVIADAETGDVIEFDTGGSFGSAQTIVLAAELVLDRTLTIVGPGSGSLTVSGDGASRVLRIEGGAVATLHDFTMADGVAPLESLAVGDVRFGGCVFVDAGASLALDGVRLTGCSASDASDFSAGGAAANLGGTLDIRDSQLDANSAASGGAVFNTGALEIIDTDLLDNGATSTGAFDGGGALYNVGTAIVTGGDVTGNAAHDGGAFFNTADGVLTLRSVILESNVAEAGGGGVFTQGELTVESSTVRENQAGTRGGGIDYFGGPGGPLSESLLQGNSAPAGGGVSIVGSSIEVIVTDSEFLENTAAERGGGMSVEHGTVDLTGSRIAGNAAANGGGVEVGVGGRILVQASDITENTASSGGGMMLRNFDDAELRDTRVSDNAAVSGPGGGIYAEIDGATSARLAIQDSSSIADNLAAGAGGGIFARDQASGVILDVLLQRITVSGNQATSGGGVFVERGFLVLFGGENSSDGVSIGQNFALFNGGGIYAEAAQVQIIKPSTVIANQARGHGGGLFIDDTDLFVDGTACMILGNVADADDDGTGIGGGVYHTGNSDLNMPERRVCLNDPDNIVGG